MKKIILLIGLLFIITGCNYKELNDLAVVDGISISKNDNNEYIVKISVINPIKKEDSTDSNYIIYESADKSIEMAFKNIIRKSPHKLYGNHINILIIDEEICKSNISEVIDYIARNNDIRKKFYILIGSNKLLESKSNSIKLPSLNIYKTLITNNKYLGYTKTYTFDEFIYDYLNKNKEISIPSIKLDDDNNINISNIGIFKDNVLEGYLTNEEALTYNFISNNINETLIKLDYSSDKFITNQINSSKTKIRVNPKNNQVNIYISGKSIIKERHKICNNDIKSIEDKLNRYIESLIISNTTNIINKYNSDIFGFRDLYYKKNPKYYKKIDKKTYLKNINIKVHSDISITSTGNMEECYGEE